MPDPNYAYVKNGDAVDQVSRILDQSQITSTTGPDAFLADFLKAGSYQKVYVFSRHRREARATLGKVTAEVTRDGATSLGKLFRRPLIFIALVIKLFSTRPNRILCGSTGSRLWASCLASKILRVPLVHSRHNRVAGSNDNIAHRLSAVLDKYAIKSSTAVICHGPYLVDEIRSLGVASNRIYEFDVDFSEFGSSVSLHNQEHKTGAHERKLADNYVLFVGRLEVDKGVTDLLRAIAEALRSNSDLNLIFAGDGVGRRELEAEISRLKLQEQVQLLGRVPHNELVPLIANAAFLVAPTRPGFPEGRCMAVMEALVLGCPAIVPNFGPFPYLIQHKSNGLVFEPGSVDDLRVQILHLLENRELASTFKENASSSGEALRTPPRTFNTAVDLAFSDCLETKAQKS